MGAKNNRRLAAEILQDINCRLSDIDSTLAELMMDSQHCAESSSGFVSHFKNDETGDPICVPEDANPDIDNARGMIDEAIDSIRHLLDTGRCPICDEKGTHAYACPDDPDSREEQRADLEWYQVITLRAMARERGIASSGNKLALINRLLPIR